MMLRSRMKGGDEKRKILITSGFRWMTTRAQED